MAGNGLNSESPDESDHTKEEGGRGKKGRGGGRREQRIRKNSVERMRIEKKKRALLELQGLLGPHNGRLTEAKTLSRANLLIRSLKHRVEVTRGGGGRNPSLNEYRREHQHVQDRREFDLYDPDTKKKDLPARVSDEDPRLTMSGMQLFRGEDLMYEQRKKLQQEQMREWTAQQIAEKDRLKMEQEHADRLYELKACELDQRAMELSQADEETRRAINVAIKDYNLALARPPQQGSVY